MPDGCFLLLALAMDPRLLPAADAYPKAFPQDFAG